MKKYIIIQTTKSYKESGTINDLVEKVNEHLEKGYVLIGSPYTFTESTDVDSSYNGALSRFNPLVTHCQAMMYKDIPKIKGFE